MKIGPLNIRLATQAPAGAISDADDDEAPPRQISTTKPLGASGTINLSGFLQTDEYISDLRGTTGLKTFDRMRNDAAVEEALGHMIEPIVSALTDMQIEPASDEEIDQYAAALCRCTIYDWLDQDWNEFTRQALGMLPFGFSVFEVIEQIVEAPVSIEQEQPDGTMLQVEHPNYLWRVPVRFAERLQRTIYKWHSQDGYLQMIEQLAFKDDGSFVHVEIPGENLMVFTLRRAGDNYTGRSILRAAYKPWYLKDVVEKIMVVAIERHGVGVLAGYLPAGREDDAAMVSRVEDILANMRSGEYSYFVSPYPKATGAAGDQGITIEIMTPLGGLPLGLVDVAEYFRGDVKAALLTRFSELGHGSVGARSVGETQTEVWHRSLESVAAAVCGVLKQRFAKIVQDNLPGARCPTVKPGVIESKNLADFATAVGTLVSSGAVEPDAGFYEWVRTELGAPNADPDAETDDETEEAESGRTVPPDPSLPDDPGVPTPGK